MKKITLISCSDLEGYTHDDHLFIKELESRGHKVSVEPWETLTDDGEDIFIVRTAWNYTDHLDKFVSTIDKVKDRLWNPLELIKWNSNKKYLLELQSAGVNVMPLQLAHDQKTLETCIETLGGDDFVIKPLVSASAKGLARVNRASLPQINNEMIVQKFYPEIFDGEISLMYFSGKFSHAIKKIPKDGEIRVQEEYGGSVSPHIPSKEELELAAKAIKQIPGAWLYARVDIVPGVGLIELECIEPALYFSGDAKSVQFLADELLQKLK